MKVYSIAPDFEPIPLKEGAGLPDRTLQYACPLCHLPIDPKGGDFPHFAHRKNEHSVCELRSVSAGGSGKPFDRVFSDINYSAVRLNSLKTQIAEVITSYGAIRQNDDATFSDQGVKRLFDKAVSFYSTRLSHYMKSRFDQDFPSSPFKLPHMTISKCVTYISAKNNLAALILLYNGAVSSIIAGSHKPSIKEFNAPASSRLRHIFSGRLMKLSPSTENMIARSIAFEMFRFTHGWAAQNQKLLHTL